MFSDFSKSHATTEITVKFDYYRNELIGIIHYLGTPSCFRIMHSKTIVYKSKWNDEKRNINKITSFEFKSYWENTQISKWLTLGGGKVDPGTWEVIMTIYQLPGLACYFCSVWVTSFAQMTLAANCCPSGRLWLWELTCKLCFHTFHRQRHDGSCYVQYNTGCDCLSETLCLSNILGPTNLAVKNLLAAII